MLILRPKIVKDIKYSDPERYQDNFSVLPRRINLSYRKRFRVPLVSGLKVIVSALAVVSFVLGSVVAPTVHTLAANQVTSNEERAELEAQLQDLEKQINEYETKVLGYEKQGRTLSGEISSLNNKIYKLNLEIKAIKLNIAQIDNQIDETQFQIGTTEEDIKDNKDSLAELLKELHANEQASLVEIFLKSPRISDFFDDLNSIALLQSGLQVTIGKIEGLKLKLEEQKDQLSLARADASTLQQYQAARAQETAVVKQQKNELLVVTKGQESKYQELLTETKKTAAEIRGRIFRLLGGGEMTFGEAYSYAKLASDATGVDAATILAILDRESALGRNVGKCNYQGAMHPTRDIPKFLEITAELGLDPNAMLVSCAISQDGAYGGAMGPSQFIPSTWVLYKDKVSGITGNKPASPWNNADAFVATGLYIADSYFSRDCKEYSQRIPEQADILQERCAAAKYYAGSRWYYYRWTYGEAVVKRASEFREDIKTITS